MACARLRLQLLGRPELVLDGRRLQITCSRKVFELLGFVATGPRGRRERDEVASTLWPDLSPTAARAALRRHLHHLSHPLSGSNLCALQRSGPWLCLTDELNVDLRDFAEEDAFAEYAGDFLDGYEAGWVVAMRAAVRDRIVAELERRIELARSSGYSDRALGLARRLEHFDCYREDNALLIAELLAQTGDTAGALRQCDVVERRLRDDFGLPASSNLFALRDRVLRGEPAARLHGFPAHSTRFIGREAEIKDLLAILDARRLTSCVGPPGVGKTRVACHVAAEFAHSHGEPAFFVDLAHCRSAEQIVDVLVAVARREFSVSILTNGPFERLEQSAALILFDNAERVTAPLGDVVRRLLKDAPRLRILVTSRIPLHVEGEALCQVAPLTLEHAAELFVDRAQLVRPTAPGMARTASAIHALCKRVDGIPLAIELVAAQLRTLTLFQLAAAPVKRSGTLRATFDASLELLDEDNRRLFQSVAVFRGSFTAEDAAAIDQRDLDQAEERLATLVDHSLLILEPSETQTARYFMLAPLREYAWALQQANGADTALRERHARLYASRYVNRTQQLNGPGAEHYVGEIDREHENICAALETLIAGRVDVDLGGRLGLALQHLWFATGRVIEASRWVDETLGNAWIDPELRIRLLFMRALMARHQTDYAVAIEGYREVIALRRAEQNEEKVATALIHLSGCLSATGDVAGALDAAREAEVFFAKHPSAYYCGHVAATLGLAALRGGDVDMAEAAFRKSLRHFQAANLELDIASSLSNLGACALARGELDAAAELSREAIERAQRISAFFVAGASQITMAIVACQSGEHKTARRHARHALEVAIATNDHERLAELFEVGTRIAVLEESDESGARLYGAAEGVRGRCRATRTPIDEADIASWTARCRERLGDARFDALRLSGESLPAGDSIAALRRVLDGG